VSRRTRTNAKIRKAAASAGMSVRAAIPAACASGAHVGSEQSSVP
jgi:hypothetical protein